MQGEGLPASALLVATSLSVASPDAAASVLLSLLMLPKTAYSVFTCSPGHGLLRAIATYVLGNFAMLVKLGSTVVPVYLWAVV